MITFTKQAFIDYAMPILEKACSQLLPMPSCEDVGEHGNAKEIIRSMLLEAYELDTQITNVKAMLFDAEAAFKGIVEKGEIQPVYEWLNAIHTIVHGNFKCAQADANPDHKCINQCYVCRRPADRNPKVLGHG